MSKAYKDANGTLYIVLQGEVCGVTAYKAHYRKSSWTVKCRPWNGVKWQATPETAQTDLDAIAAKRGWKTVSEECARK